MANSITASTSHYNSFTEDSTSAKAVPLYHHEQVPFISNRHHSYSHQQQHKQQTYQSGPLIAREHQDTEPLQQQYQSQQVLAQESQQQQQQQQPLKQQQQQQQSSNSVDLQDIIYSYQAHPELLKLILLSKLEEDKRRAEEAKLRAKELDLLLIQQQQQQQEHQQQQYQHNTTVSLQSEHTNSSTMNDNTANTYSQRNDTINTEFMQPTPPLSNSSSTDGRSVFQPRPSLDALLSNASTNNASSQVAYLSPQQQQPVLRRESMLCSSFTENTLADEFDERTFSPMTSTTITTNTSTAAQTPVSATPTFMSLDSYPTSSENINTNTTVMFHQYHQQPTKHVIDSNNQYSSSVYQQQQQSSRNIIPASIPTTLKYDLLQTMPPSTVTDMPRSTLRPRRRREMQAITKIVETREYPYNDGHFWKNNGNTVQKKTGNKSVYYKCSNSSKGCPVNKTVTWKENGEFLIKYRGDHLPDCNKVHRIVDI